MDAISAIDEETARARPEADGWSTAEVLAHLLDLEQLLNARIALALERDRAEVTPRADGEHDEGAALGRRAPVPQLVHGLLASRRRTELLIERMTPADLDRSVYHPLRREQITIDAMLSKLAAHEEEHAAQIAELRSRLPARPAGAAASPQPQVIEVEDIRA